MYEESPICNDFRLEIFSRIKKVAKWRNTLSYFSLPQGVRTGKAYKAMASPNQELPVTLPESARVQLGLATGMIQVKSFNPYVINVAANSIITIKSSYTNNQKYL